MAVTQRDVLFYNRVLAPWQRIATTAPAVVGMRLSLLPWLWMFDPDRARRESDRMVGEKREAVTEMRQIMLAAPLQFWMNMATPVLWSTPAQAWQRATVAASTRLARPMGTRVRANRRRLGGLRD